jgi:hypothetical protein
MKLLDLGKMHKVSTDGRTTTFQHDEGHIIKILHSALPRIHQEQIKRIPMAKMAEGGVAETPEETPAVPAPETEKKDVQAPGGTHITINAAAPAPQTPPPLPAEVPAVPNAIKQEESAVPRQANVNIPGSPAPSTPAITTSTEPTEQDFGTTASAVNQEAAEDLQHKVNKVVATGNQMRNVLNDFDQHQKENPIDPNHYAASPGDARKTDLAIGAMLLGFGGHANVGLDFINKQIDRDVAAQQQNFENKKTIFGAYKEMFGSDDVAANLAKATTLDIVNYKVHSAALKDPTPQKIEAAKAFNDKAQAEKNQLINSAAQMHADRNHPDKQGTYSPKPLLLPGAEKKYKRLQYDPSISESQKHEIERQYGVATQADKARAGVRQIFGDMTQQVTPGGWIARNVEHIPIIGNVGSKLVGQATDVLSSALPGGDDSASNIQVNRSFEANREALRSAITSALRGVEGISTSSIDETIDKWLPEAGDDQKRLAEKFSHLDDFIRLHVATGALKARGLTGE